MGSHWRCHLLGLILLEAILSTAGVSLEEQPRTGYACEGSTLTIECAPDRRVKILRANYGRFKRDVCNEGGSTELWDMQCMSTRSLRIVTHLCDGKSGCSILASNRIFGDTCSTTFKYLEVEYTCVGAFRNTTSAAPVTNATTTSSTAAPNTTITGSTTTATTRRASTTTTVLVIPPSIHPLVKHCEAIVVRNISWPDTAASVVAVRPCPNNDEADATWQCGRSPLGWIGRPDLSKCVSPSVVRLHSTLAATKAEYTFDTVNIVADDIAGFSDGDHMYGGDISELTQLLQDMVESVNVTMHAPQGRMAPGGAEAKVKATGDAVKKVNKAILKTGSNLLSAEKKDAWKDLPQATQAEVATRLVSTVEHSAFQLADTMDEGTVDVNINVNILVQVNIVGTNDESVEDVIFPQKEVSSSKWDGNMIKLTGKTIKKLGVEGLAKLIFVTYDNLEEMLQPLQADDPGVISHTVDTGNRGDTEIKITEETKGREVKMAGEEGEGKYTKEKDVTNEDTRVSDNAVERIVNTKIISASVNQRKDLTELAEPIIYTLEHKTTKNIYHPTCTFWEYSERDMKGHWNDFGCKLVDTNVTHTVCACRHLTNFAVLMDVGGNSNSLSWEHLFSLSLITYIGCFISTICLFLAWLTFCFLKNLQCDRNTIHKNLVFCLFMAEMVFLMGIAQYRVPLLCSLVAGILHYFFLASFAWMCLEGVQLYIMLVEVFEAEKSRVKFFYLAGYGVPAIIVAVSAAVYPTGYGTINHCWLTVERGFIWAFVGPVAVVISVNVVMLSIAIYTMCKHAAATAAWKMKEKSKMQNISLEESQCVSRETVGSTDTLHGPGNFVTASWVLGAVVLVVLLGLTWAFGLLYVNEHTLAMAYIFTILNSLQGLFIFVFHCIMNDKVQKEYKRYARRSNWLPDFIRINYGGAKAYVSSTPNQSTSSGNKLVVRPENKFTVQYLQKLLRERRRKRLSTTSLSKSSSCNNHPPSKWQCSNPKQALLNNYPDSDPNNSTYSGAAYRLYPATEHCRVAEDDEHYLEPVKIRIDDYDGDGVNGDLSMIDGSVVDSACVSEYCQQNMGGATLPINVDKYKIQGGDVKPRLSAISQERGLSESEYSDGELLDMTGNDYEEIADLPCMETEQNLLNNLIDDDEAMLRRKMKAMGGSDEMVWSPPSLNDLSKDADSEHSKDSAMYISTPNIKYRAGTMKEVKKAGSQSSLPAMMPSKGDFRGDGGGASQEKLKSASSSWSGDVSCEDQEYVVHREVIQLDAPKTDALRSSDC